MIEYISFAIVSLLLFVLFFVFNQRFVGTSFKLLHQSIATLRIKLSSLSVAKENVEKINDIFLSIEYVPFQRRWKQCYFEYKKMGEHFAFINLDGIFQIEPILDESLMRKMAHEIGRILIAIGILLTFVFGALTLVLGNWENSDFIRIAGLCLSLMALTILLTTIYRLLLIRTEQKASDELQVLLTHLKDYLPHSGQNHLIEDLFALQKLQTDLMYANTEQMKSALTDYTTNTLATQIGTRFDDAITAHLSPAIQKMADVQTDLLHRLQTDQHKRLDQLFTLFTKQVGELLGQQLSGMAHSVHSATSGMEKVVAAFEEVRIGVKQTLDQNKDTIVLNNVVLEKLEQTQTRLAERFSDATLLLDDVMTSMKILADTTGNANTATLMLTEQAIALQQDTGNKLETLRTTLDERLAAAVQVTEQQQAVLVEHASLVQTGLGAHANSVQSSLEGFSGDVRNSLGNYTESIKTSMEEFNVKFQEAIQQQSDTSAARQQEQAEAMFGTLFLDIRAMEEHTSETLRQAQAWSLEVSKEFSDSASSIFERLEKHNREVSVEIQSQGRTNANLLTLTNKTINESIANQNKVFELYSTRLLELLKNDADAVIHSMHVESSELLQTLPTQMREAFDSFTAAMGDTMRSTLTDSVEIIDRLGEKTERLHSEFELYFSKSEGNTEKLIDDMRFAMEGSLAKFTELTTDSMNQLRAGNAEAMDAFSEQTRRLMDAVDQQTSTISLYVKDMGIDMSELNKGLKDSVSTFTEQLQSGVQYTFKEFDMGLSEIVQRMTELNISMHEAVQSLPDTLNRLSGGKIV